jgi:F-type H+-transporting ATPase subunit epsilon
MDGTFQLRIFSSKGLEVEAVVRSVTLPTESGEAGVLANHCDYVGLLSTGFARYEVGENGGEQYCLVSGGLATFEGNTLTLLADTVDKPESVDQSLLSEDVEALKTELEVLSLFDPEREVLSQKLARITYAREMLQ